MEGNSLSRAICLFTHGIIGRKKYPIAFYTKKERAALKKEVRHAIRKYTCLGEGEKAESLWKCWEYINTFSKAKNLFPSRLKGKIAIFRKFLVLLYSGKTPANFWDGFRKRYSLKKHESTYEFWDYFFQFRPNPLYIKPWLELHAKGHILDLCAGANSYIKVDVAADISAKALGKNKLAKKRVRIKPLPSRLPFKDGSFDTVMLNSALNYFKFHRQVFAQIRRILRTNGILLITNAPVNAHHPAKYFEKEKITPSKTKRMLKMAGFRVKDESRGNLMLIIAKKKP